MEKCREIKIVLLGDAGVGKSSILSRFVYDKFDLTNEATIGASFTIKTKKSKDGINNRLQIWDTSGQEKYNSIAPMYYKDAQVAIVFFDTSDSKTVEPAKKWMNLLQENGPEDIILALVGTKIDKDETDKKLCEESRKYAKSINAIFGLTSALEDQGIKELFNEILEEIEKIPDARRNTIKLGGIPNLPQNPNVNTTKKVDKKCC